MPTEQGIAELETISGPSFFDLLKGRGLDFSLVNIDCLSTGVKKSQEIKLGYPGIKYRCQFASRACKELKGKI